MLHFGYITVFTLMFASELNELLVVGFCVLVYLAVLYCGYEDRLQRQRELSTWLYRKLWGHWISVHWYGKYQAQMVGVRLSLVLLTLAWISLALEGRLFATAMLGIHILLILLTSLVASDSPATLRFAGRMNAFNQMLFFFLVSKGVDETMLRRMIITRALTSVCLFESLDELFLQVVVFPTLLISYRLSAHEIVIAKQPSVIFLLTVLPLDLGGIRCWFLKSIQLYTHSILQMKNLRFIVVLIPALLIHVLFGPFLQSGYLLTVMRIVHIPFAIILYVNKDQIERVLHPLLSQEHHGTFTPQATQCTSGTLFQDNSNARHAQLDPERESWASSPHSSHSQMESGISNSRDAGMSERPTHNVNTQLQAIMPAIVERLLLPSFERYALVLISVLVFQSSDMALTAIFTMHHLYFSLSMNMNKLGLCTILADVSLVSAFYATLVVDPVMSCILNIIIMFNQILTIAHYISSENSLKLMKLMRDSNSFLDHSVKQKLAAAGGCLEHILDYAHDNQVEFLTKELMQDVRHECLHSGISCHLSSYAWRFETGQNLSSLRGSQSDLYDMIEQWIESGEFLPTDVEFKLTDPTLQVGVRKFMDWDTFKAYLQNLLRHQIAVKILMRRSPNRKWVQLRFISSTPFHVNSYMSKLQKTVAKALGGRLLRKNLIEFPMEDDVAVSPKMGNMMSPVPNLPCSSPNESQYRQLSTLSSGNRQGFLPKRLSIAVLDDNALVRKSLQVILSVHLCASPCSFTSGSSLEEAKFFPLEVTNKQVDIAVFDENLEYSTSEVTIKGSALAKQAYDNGFAGCMVLHSANADLGENLPNYFHGFVEKTSSKDVFISKLALAFENYQRSQLGSPSPSRVLNEVLKA